MKFSEISKYKTFDLRNCISICCLQNGGHFIPTSSYRAWYLDLSENPIIEDKNSAGLSGYYPVFLQKRGAMAVYSVPMTSSQAEFLNPLILVPVDTIWKKKVFRPALILPAGWLYLRAHRAQGKTRNSPLMVSKYYDYSLACLESKGFFYHAYSIYFKNQICVCVFYFVLYEATCSVFSSLWCEWHS